MTSRDELRRGAGYVGLPPRDRLASAVAAGLALALAGIITWQIFLVFPTLPRSGGSALKLFNVTIPTSLSTPQPPQPRVNPVRNTALAAPARPPSQPAPQSAATDAAAEMVAPPTSMVSVPLPAGLIDDATPNAGDGPGELDGVADRLVGRGLVGQDRSPPLERADWIQRPTPADVKREWPRGKHLPAGPVLVELVCTVRPDGHPTRCKVVHENPPGFGFGAAAARMAQRATVRPRMSNGMPSTSRVIIPLTFTVN